MLNELLARDVKGIVFHASINRLFLKVYVYLLKNRLNRKYGAYKAYIYISKSTSKKLLLSIYYSTLNTAFVHLPLFGLQEENYSTL